MLFWQSRVCFRERNSADKFADTSDKNSDTFWRENIKITIFGWEKHREKLDTFLVKKKASRHCGNKKLFGAFG